MLACLGQIEWFKLGRKGLGLGLLHSRTQNFSRSQTSTHVSACEYDDHHIPLRRSDAVVVYFD